MRVLHIITRIEKSGPNRVLQDLASAQVDLGHSVCVVSLQKKRDTAAHVLALRAAGVQVISLETRRTPIVGDVKTVRDMLDTAPFDLVHVHCLRSLVMASLAGAAPLVATSHNIPHEDWAYALGPVKGLPVAAINYAFLRRTSGVATINDRMQDEMSRRGIFAMQVNNPVQLSSDLPVSRTGTLLRFVSVGHLVRRKNPQLILDALEMMGPRAQDIVVDFVGDGPLRKCLEASAQESPAQVNFHGFHAEPAQFFRDADAYISASLSEGMPISVLEAFSAGLPAILSNISGHRLRGAPDQAVTFFEPSVQSLAATWGRVVSRVMTVPNSAISEWTERMFSPKSVARSYDDFYAQALKFA